MLLNAFSGFGAGSRALPPEVAVIAVTFDGTNDYLTRGADLTGNANSKLVTGSFWWRMNSAIGAMLFQSESDSFRVFLSAPTYELYIDAKDNGGLRDLEVQSSGGYNDTSWHHALFSFDMSDTSKRHLYIDDVDVLSVTTYSNDLLDFTRADHAVGAKTDGSAKFNGDMAEIWLNFGGYIDFATVTNRRKFISANGKPVDLNSDGSGPIGSAPFVYLSGAVASWHTNDGSGGGFTENGALTAAATSPSD